jgi:flagellar biogenesis protein FliO
MTISEATDVSQNVRLDYSNTAITIIQGVDVGQNTRLTVIEGTNSSQNVRLDYSNTAITIIQGVDVGQNNRMTIIEGVDVTQNTNIANKLNLTGSLNQTVSGNVTISQDLIVSGNLIITGNIASQNVQQLAVADPLIILGIGNYVSDTKDIGFAGHYNDGTNAHAGLIRDSGTKEFYVFQGYTPELDSNNNVIITDPTFIKANLNANYVKGNLVATTAVVNGIDLSTYTQATYAQANVTIGVDTSQNARMTIIEVTDVSQNSRMTIIEGVDVGQNTAITIIQGVDVAQNTRLTVIEDTNISQNVRLDYSNTAITIIQGVDIAQNTSISATDGKMQSAYNTANNAVANIGPVITTNTTAQVVIANTLVSTSNTTGALLVQGGVGVKGNVATDGIIFADNTTQTTAATVLASSGVYGGSSAIPVISVSANGRISGISNTSLSLQDQQITRPLIRDYRLVQNSLGNVSGNTTIDISLGNYISANVTGAVTWTFSNAPASSNAAGFILKLSNGGSATQLWPSPSVKWPSGTAPSLTTSGVDTLAFITDDGGTTWRGVLSMSDSR